MIDPFYPSLEQVGKNKWKLLEPVRGFFPKAELPLFREIKVPTGFQTDGASVPRIFWNIVPPMSNYTNAAVLHDYLYVKKGDIGTGDDLDGHSKKYLRKQADLIFLQAMIELRVSRWKRRTMYRAVRMFGPRW